MLPHAWELLERRFGPHTCDRFASPRNALLPCFNTEVPTAGSAGAPALAQEWGEHNNFVFPPVHEMAAVAQLLASDEALRATVVAPYWPAQPWFQQLQARAEVLEVWPLSQLAKPPPGLHLSAQHALSSEALACFRVEAQRVGAAL